MEENLQLDVVLIPENHEEENIISIFSPQLPNVVTQGENEAEAKRMLKEAVELYLEEHPKAKQQLIKAKQQAEHPTLSTISLA